LRRKPVIVVVGGGVAGLYAALCAADEADVLLIAKAPPAGSNSWHAQGGVAAALGEDDSPALHAADTLRAGRGTCRESAVGALTEEAPARLADLVRLGARFEPDLGREGGHSRRRIAHAGGAETGKAIAAALAARVRSHPRIELAECEAVLGLVEREGRCDGVVTDRRTVLSRATLLATGGYAALWSRTTNPPGAVGEGLLLAYRAGAALADLEVVQFHPTALADDGFLLSEALRGEGALLVGDDGGRFTDELAPRDVVTRAIVAHGGARLDLRPIDRGRFPGLMATLERAGYDPAVEPIPVSPAAHYSVGGIVTDLDGRTTLPGLYAAGECAATGVHGANRLASNSLLECLVFGRRAALAAVSEPAMATGPTGVRPLEGLAGDSPARRWRAKGECGKDAGSVRTRSGTGATEDAAARRLAAGRAAEGHSGQAPDSCHEPVTAAIRQALWEDAGVIRSADGLERLCAVDSLLPRLVAESALARRESRGAHFRSDFPTEDEAFAGHVVVRRGEAPRLERWS
jgi:L-aspartate oxidase